MINIRHLTKKFADKTALDDLTMTLAPGEVMGLIGQNGAGKTTTFRMILNFIQPTSGSITWNQAPISNTHRTQIGFLPEERGLYQKQTIEQQVLYFAQLHGMSRYDAKKKLMKLMDRLAVVGKVTDKVQTLSKGNAQKIQLIATIIFEPTFLILDEPFSGLDPVNTALMMQEIKRLQDQGAMIIFSSHDMAGVEQLSDKITMLKEGQTVLQGRPSDIRAQFGRTELYLEAPIETARLEQIPGVLAIKAHGAGRQVHLANPQVGETIFDLATAQGYIPVFAQEPPTLDAIFRLKASTNPKGGH